MDEFLLTHDVLNIPLELEDEEIDIVEECDKLIARSQACSLFLAGQISLDDYLDFIGVEQKFDLDNYLNLVVDRLTDLYINNRLLL